MDGSNPGSIPAAPERVAIPEGYATAITPEVYAERYRLSIEDPDAFWRSELDRLDWVKKPRTIRNVDWDPDSLSIQWFEDGVLNVSVNCIDRHLPERGGEVALVWEGDNPGFHHSITYSQLHNHVCRFAN
jgi:acetyl-CoA synthetase